MRDPAAGAADHAVRGRVDLRLVHMPPGTRPIRTVCGVDFGAVELNRVIAPFQAAVLRALGLETMTPSVVAEHVGKASA